MFNKRGRKNVVFNINPINKSIIFQTKPLKSISLLGYIETINLMISEFPNYISCKCHAVGPNKNGIQGRYLTFQVRLCRYSYRYDGKIKAQLVFVQASHGLTQVVRIHYWRVPSDHVACANYPYWISLPKLCKSDGFPEINSAAQLSTVG